MHLAVVVAVVVDVVVVAVVAVVAVVRVLSLPHEQTERLHNSRSVLLVWDTDALPCQYPGSFS